MNRPGSGQPDEFATRGTCEKRLREHIHRRVSLFCASLLLDKQGQTESATRRALPPQGQLKQQKTQASGFSGS